MGEVQVQTPDSISSARHRPRYMCIYAYLQYVMEQFLEKEQRLESPPGMLVGNSCDQLKWQQICTCMTLEPFLTHWVQGNP